MTSIKEMKNMRDQARRQLIKHMSKGGFRIQVGMGTCGIASGAKAIMDAFIQEIEDRQLKHITVTQVGCMGECAYEPMAEVIDAHGQSFVYCSLTPNIVKDIVDKHLVNQQPMEGLLLSSRKG